MKSRLPFALILVIHFSTSGALGETPAGGTVTEEAANADNARRLMDDEQLESWLENMVVYHRFNHQEIRWATGLSDAEIDTAMNRFGISNRKRPERKPGDLLTTLPYPGGRHPRIGFLDGALRPQRETKLSVFTPWDPDSYVVADIPEAIWSNLGLTYLAHTHIPTVWDEQNVELPVQEWQHADGAFRMRRRLPNGIEFATVAKPHSDHIQMEMWLHNGTDETLSDLRVQNCVMLKMAKGFEQQVDENKYFKGCYACANSNDGGRWIISAWEPVQRCWGNAPCPCLHSDPKFPDTAPGRRHVLRGWLSFYAGTDIDDELKRIEDTGWKSRELLAEQWFTSRSDVGRSEDARPASDTSSVAQFGFDQKVDRLDVTLDNRVFGSYLFEHDELTRPAWIGIHSLTGVQVSRDFPAIGDNVDHRYMHPGIWISFGDLNGQDYWRMKSRTRHDRFSIEPTAVDNRLTFAVVNSYLSADGLSTMCEETTQYSLTARQDGVQMNVRSSFENADADFYFGDQEESGLAFRMSTQLSSQSSSDGDRNETTNSDSPSGIQNEFGDRNGDQVWGKQSAWVDFAGKLDGRHVGIMVRPHATNSRQCWMHARDYGLVACNPFPRQPAERREPYVKTWVRRGEVYRLGYDVLIHDTVDKFDPATVHFEE